MATQKTEPEAAKTHVIQGEAGTPSEGVYVLVQIGHHGRVYVRVAQDPTWPNEPVAELIVPAAVATRKSG